MDCCQLRNSSVVSVYRWQASSRLSKPPRTAATTSALRRITHRRVFEGGRSAIVRGLPSGPMTYFTLGRWGSVMIRSHTQLTIRPRRYALGLKVFLSRRSKAVAVSRGGRPGDRFHVLQRYLHAA